MPLFWVVNKHDGELRIFLQQSSHVVHARIKANISGHEGEFVEAHELDPKTAKNVPKKMIGRVLSQVEAVGLLKKIA